MHEFISDDSFIIYIAIQKDVRRRALRKREREAAAAAASSKTQ